MTKSRGKDDSHDICLRHVLRPKRNSAACFNISLHPSPLKKKERKHYEYTAYHVMLVVSL